MQINAETNIHQVLAEIERINQKGGNLSRLMKDIGGHVRQHGKGGVRQ